ncbi:hypothetical protein [Streptomyces sp. NPDC014734]|uniref:hypothetical protein n=1 Tax=Streptomyces sp. NPDC014734 TaxID=3364886 RepID=UPI0036FC190B
MKHQQVLEKLAARGLVRAMDEELARWVQHQMRPPGRSHAEIERAVLPPVLRRWRCLLDGEDAGAASRNVARVALAALLHKYGFQDPHTTAAALRAVDDLNHDVVLSDAFERRSPEIKELLASAPVPLTRRPRRPRALSFLRPGDVISFEVSGRFHGAFVRDVHDADEFPVVEFYAGSFTRPPTWAELSGRDAAAERGRARFGVVGLAQLPDPAHQVRAVEARRPLPPAGEEPRPGEGLWTLTDLMSLQEDVFRLFGDRAPDET